MTKKTAEEIMFPKSTFDRAAAALSPPFNWYSGRDTSRFALMFDGEEGMSRTSQEMADEVDVNNIMARYVKTGTVPVYMDRTMLDGDLHTMSFHEMQNAIAEASSAFNALPAVVRARFDNDPAKFVEFASDKANLAEMKELGMLSPEAVERLDREAADAAAAVAGASSAAEKPPGQAPKEPSPTQ